jgi:polar amino acid transport system permease protein
VSSMSPTQTAPNKEREPDAAIVAVPVKNYGTTIAAAIVVIIAVAIGYSLLTNPNFQWGVVAGYVFSPVIIQGLGRTLLLTVLTMILAVFLGTGLALAPRSKNPILRLAGLAYIWFFRGTPVLVQLIFWYNLSALYQFVVLQVPFGPELFRVDTNSLITPWTAALLGLVLNEAAYMAEIIRAGIGSVDNGQQEAASALGISKAQSMRRIILPQAMRVVIPPTANETINLLKVTSLVSVITLPELLYSAQIIYSRTFETIPLLIVASLWYLAITTVLTVGQNYMERKYGRGNLPNSVKMKRVKRILR